MLKDTLNEDLKKAMLEKDNVAKVAIQMIKSAILLWEKDAKNIDKEVTDEVVIEVVAKELKKRKERTTVILMSLKKKHVKRGDYICQRSLLKKMKH